MSWLGDGDGALASSSHPMSLTGGGDGAPASSSSHPMSLTAGEDGLFSRLSLRLAVKPYERRGVNQRVQLRSSLKTNELEALLSEQGECDWARKLREYFCGEWVIPMKCGSVVSGEIIYPDDDSLWCQFKCELAKQLLEYAESSNVSERRVVFFQVDTRKPGILNASVPEDGLNVGAKFVHNFNRGQVDSSGIYLWFDASDGIFARCSIYWLGAILLWFLRQAFPDADIHYIDTDAIVFLEVFESLCRKNQATQDLLYVASDGGSPINAGWVSIKKLSAPTLRTGMDEAQWDERRRQCLALAATLVRNAAPL